MYIQVQNKQELKNLRYKIVPVICSHLNTKEQRYKCMHGISISIETGQEKTDDSRLFQKENLICNGRKIYFPLYVYQIILIFNYNISTLVLLMLKVFLRAGDSIKYSDTKIALQPSNDSQSQRQMGICLNSRQG